VAIVTPIAGSLPVLYSFRRCPYAMRARLAILASGQSVELREVILANKPAALLKASPKGTVPVLVLPDGTVLEQSLDIMLWALRRKDLNGWLPADDAAMAQALALVAQCDGAFKYHLDRYKYPNRFGLTDGSAHRTEGARFLDLLNSALSDRGTLHHSGWGLCDATIAPFVRQFAHTDAAWFAVQPWRPLQHWLAAFEASEAFTQVMHKYPAWSEGVVGQLLPAGNCY
jgi:glutathione S-transferase